MAVKTFLWLELENISNDQVKFAVKNKKQTISIYDQEIPQSRTADQPMAP